MKKMLAIAMVLALCLAMFAGCGDTAASAASAAPAVTENVTSVAEPATPTQFPEVPEASVAETPAADSTVEEEPIIGMPNPLTEVTADALEIALTAPKDATDVHYYTLEDADGQISQMTFKLGDAEYCYRAQPTGKLSAYDISGMYYEGWETKSVKVHDCDGTVMTCEEASVIYWLDVVPGVNYTLATATAEPADSIAMIADEVFVTLQGDAEGDAEDGEEAEAGEESEEGEESEKDEKGETDDDTAMYADEEGNTVKLIDEGDGIYSIGVSILQLTSMRGTAYAVDDGYEFAVLDPNGEEVRGYFTPNENNVFTLEFIASDWDLLEEGTTFENFIPVSE